MRRITIGETAAASGGDGPARERSRGRNWLREHWRIITLFAIIIAAFIVRFVYAYGISVGNDYALSGGTSAASHLRVINEILAGTYDPSNMSSVNFPYGAASTSGPFFSYAVAGVAFIATLFGVSNATAAAAALAWSAPVFGALTCFPVYLIGKKAFKDEIIGMVSALFYAAFTICIMTTPFSNGTEYPLVCFLASWMFYVIVCMIRTMDELGVTGIKAVFIEKKLLIDAAIIGELYAMISLSWPDFLVLPIVAAVILGASMIFDRVTARDMGVSVGAVDLALIIGTAIAAVYYLSMGLWTAVFSGGCVVALLTVVLSVAAVFLEKKPWVVTIPGFLIAIGAIFVVLYLAVPDVYNAIIYGNGYYDNQYVQDLNQVFYRTSISSMAAWYGWITVWCPLFVGAWMVYKYRENRNSRLYNFLMFWFLSMFCIGWFDSGYAVVAGSAFAVASAYGIVTVLRIVDVKGYIKSLRHIRGLGVKGVAKRVFNIFPFTAVAVVVFLIATPAVVYGCDAMTPTNRESSSYFGGLGYTINTADSNNVTAAWESSSNWYNPNNGALLTWYGYSDTASTLGNITTVTASNGGGTFTMANALLSGGSAGAVSAMIVRLMVNDKGAVTVNDLQKAGLSKLDAQRVYDIIQSGSECNETYRSVYEVLEYYSFPVVCAVYKEAINNTGNKIGYIEVDASMLPINYGDSSYFSTIGYIGGYDRDDYGAVTDFYSFPRYFSTISSYTTKMYSTFLYQAVLGMAPSLAGYSNSYSYLGAVATDDGSVTVTPGYGLQGFKIAYWTIKYNPDDDATTSSDGWETMSIFEALAKQKSNGGVINYLSSVIVYEYVGDDDVYSDKVSGIVSYGNNSNAAGVAVYVYDTQTSLDGSNLGEGVLYSYAVTGMDGKYDVLVPHNSTSYKIIFVTGRGDDLGSGTVTATKTCKDVKGGKLDFNIGITNARGIVTLTDEVQDEEMEGYLELTNTLSSNDSRYSSLSPYKVDVTAGAFSMSDILPGTYTANLYKTDGTLLNTVSLTIPAGDITGLQISAEGNTIIVTVYDEFGGYADGGITIEAVDTSTGQVFSAKTEGGDSSTSTKAKISVLPGTYSIRVADGEDYVTYQLSTVTSSSSSGGTASVYLYEAVKIIIDAPDAPDGTIVSVTSQSFQTIAVVSGDHATAKVPVLGNATYSVYAVSGSYVYWGVTKTFTDKEEAVNITLQKSKAIQVTGTIKHNDSKVFATVALVGEDRVNKKFSVAFSTDSDGKYTATVPAGRYTIYAYDSSYDVLYKKIDVSRDMTVDLALVNGRMITRSVNYTTTSDTSTTGVAPVKYTDVTAEFNVDGDEYIVYGMTNSSGTATFYVPDDVAVTFPSWEVKGGYFANTKIEEVTVAGNSSGPATAAKFTMVKFAVPKFVLLSDGKPVDGCEMYLDDCPVKTGADIDPGKHTLEVKGKKHYYGSVYIYPTTHAYAITLYDSMVTLEFPSSSTASIIAAENDDGDTGDYHERTTTSNMKIWYVESGFNYAFKITSTKTVNDEPTTMLAYYSVDAKDAIPYSAKISDNEMFESVAVTGKVGLSSASGSLTVTVGDNSNKAVFTSSISNGKYSIDVPKGAPISFYAKTTTTSDNITYNSSATITDLTFNKESEYNFGVTFNDEWEQAAENVSEAKFEFGGSGKNSTVKISFDYTNTGDFTNTYILAAGSALSFTEAATPVNIEKDGTGHFEVTATFDEAKVAAGGTNMKVTLNTLDGTTVATVVVPLGAYTTSGGKAAILAADKDDVGEDVVNDYSYKYALTFKNDDPAVSKIAFSIDNYNADHWMPYLVWNNGMVVKPLLKEDGDSCDPTPVTALIAGFTTSETLYIMLINTKGDTEPVPDITYSISGDLTESGKLTPSVTKIDPDDQFASGGGATNSKSALDVWFWGLLVAVIGVLLLLVWESMRRGVFGRRN